MYSNELLPAFLHAYLLSCSFTQFFRFWLLVEKDDLLAKVVYTAVIAALNLKLAN